METLLAFISVGAIIATIVFLKIIKPFAALAKDTYIKYMEVERQLEVVQSQNGQLCEAVDDVARGISHLVQVEENRPKGNPLNFYTIDNQSGAHVKHFYHEQNRDDYFAQLKQTHKAKYKKGMRTIKTED
jgi:hypothetical protein